MELSSLIPRGVVITLSNITYTWNPGPIYCFGFDMYLGAVPGRLFINPKDPSTYTFYKEYRYLMQDQIIITEKEEGFCAGCQFGVVMRTQNETQWTLTSHLLYGK